MSYLRNPAKTFCIAVKIKDGGTYLTTIHEARKIAIGRAFGELREAGLEGEKVVFCKSRDELTEDERWEWGMQTSTDEARWQRKQRENRLPADMLDLY